LRSVEPKTERWVEKKDDVGDEMEEKKLFKLD
jgi:hypothetical protein